MGIDVELVEAVANGVASVDDVRRLTRQVERAANRIDWREAVQRRNSRLAQVLAAAEKAIGERFAGRNRDDRGRWLLWAQAPDGSSRIAARIGGGAARKLDELKTPIPVDVFCPDLLDLDELRRLTRAKESV